MQPSRAGSAAAVLCLAAAGWCHAAPSLTLFHNGKSPYVLLVSRDASPSERHAAEELQHFLQQMSGAHLPIATDDRIPKNPLILVGRSRALDRLNLNIAWDSLGDEGYRVVTSGKHLVIAGGRKRGTLIAAYTFLDRLGFRWYAPGVERIPHQPTLAIEPLDLSGKPQFEYREVFFTEAWDRDWSARNRLNGQSHQLDDATGGKVQYFPFVHSFYQMIPPEKYFNDHPEYFSLIDGKRRWERGQLCLTNPEVVRLGVEAVRAWIREHPEARIFSVSQNDWTGWCECDRCRRVEEEEGGVHSGPLLRYVNQVAAEIAKTNPDKLIDTLAYWYTERAPSKVKPGPNVRIRICPIGACEAHPYEQCPYNRLFVRILEDWNRVTSNLYVWHYNTNFSHYLNPFPDFRELGAEIDLYRRHGVVGMFLQGAYAPGGGGEMAELRSYVLARLLSDSKADVDREVNEFMEAYYESSWKPMRAYFDLLHDQMRAAPGGKGHHLWIFQQPRTPYLSREFLDRAAVLFRAAEQQASSDAVRRRVRKAKLSLDYVELNRSRQFRVDGDLYQPPDLDSLKTRFAAFLASARDFGVQQLHEGREIGEDEKSFAARMHAYRVVTLENAAVRVRLVPELNARIIEILDKASGRNLLRVPDAASNNYPDLSGAWMSVYSDYHGKEDPVHWTTDLLDRPARYSLDGTTARGLAVRKTVELAADGTVSTAITVRNNSHEPRPVALLARADYSPVDDLDGMGMAIDFTKVDGQRINKAFFERGQESTGSMNLTGTDRPHERWTAYHTNGSVPGLMNVFRSEQIDRCFLNWSARDSPLTSLATWSRDVTLAAGEEIRLDAQYRTVPAQGVGGGR